MSEINLNDRLWFCLRAPGYVLTLWCALGLLVAAQYKCQLELQLQLQLRKVFPICVSAPAESTNQYNR